MNVSIGGLTTGTYSALSVSGNTSLGGTVTVAIVNGLVLTSGNIGQTFTILTTTGTLTGSFTNGTVTSGTDGLVHQRNRDLRHRRVHRLLHRQLRCTHPDFRDRTGLEEPVRSGVTSDRRHDEAAKQQEQVTRGDRRRARGSNQQAGQADSGCGIGTFQCDPGWRLRPAQLGTRAGDSSDCRARGRVESGNRSELALAAQQRGHSE